MRLALDEEELDRLADVLADRIALKLDARLSVAGPSGWLDTKRAADHLAITVNALHKLTQAKAIPFHQDRAGGKLYFRADELDRWRIEHSQ